MGIPRIFIIHGLGKGKLKAAIAERCRSIRKSGPFAMTIIPVMASGRARSFPLDRSIFDIVSIRDN